jgi:hypothetical protein
MPRKRSARAVTAASCVIEIDDVFDATIAPGFAIASILAQDLDLDRRVLGRRLDHEVDAASSS